MAEGRVERLEVRRVSDMKLFASYLVPMSTRDRFEWFWPPGGAPTEPVVEVWSCPVPHPTVEPVVPVVPVVPMFITLAMVGGSNDEGARYNASTVIEVASTDDAEFAGRDFARYFHALQKGMNTYWTSAGSGP